MNTRGNWKWQKTRKKWKKQNPPDKYGYYRCHLCQGWVHTDKVSLDHVKEAALYPDLQYNLGNLEPSHTRCNLKKNGKGVFSGSYSSNL